MTITIENLELARFFLAISLLLASAHFFGYIFTKFRLPKVVGEIFGGLLLGPTFLGFFAPEFYNRIFLAEGKLLAIVYWFGLVLLMFTSGFELERKFNKYDKKTIIWLVIGSTVFPLLFGWLAASFFDLSKLIGSANNVLALKLIIVVSIAVTSIPVLSKIFIDLNIIKTRFAKIVFIMFKSMNIFDKTGIEVTAIETTIMSFKAKTLFALPISFDKSKNEAASHPNSKGNTVEPMTSQMIVFLSYLLNFLSSSNPDVNINKTSPNQ